MKTTILIFTLLASLFGSAQAQTTSPADAILGEWLSPKKDSRIQVYKKGDKYFGKILWGTGGDPKDVKNPDPKLRSRELLGITILNNFVYNGSGTWENGTIYDPREGKTYNCTLALESANALKMRGYIGISLFGRTEIWSRAK